MLKLEIIVIMLFNYTLHP